MTTVTPEEQKKARLRFLGLYGVSLVLIFIVVSAFWQNKGGIIEKSIDQEVAESNFYFFQTDTLLHARMEQMDKAFADYLTKRTKGNHADAGSFFAAKKSFASVLDSIEQQAAYLSNGPKKNAMTTLSSKFRVAFTERSKILDAVALLPRQKGDTSQVANASNGQASAELEELKKILVDKETKIAALEKSAQAVQPGNEKGMTELLNQKQQELAGKDKIIAFLENQLKQAQAQKQVVMTSSHSPSESEWKQKYASLKDSYDKVSANEKSLKSAYKTVADDNRRLLNQLQTMRKN
jgi:hypothetical protein